ncbi:MAG: type II secretion system F family protein [bacterium]|nr:type II secretion system F family protein [bacterium]
MALFEYQCLDQAGKNHKGKTDAPNARQAAAKLQAKGWYVIELKPAKAKNSLFQWRGQRKQKVPAKTITAFTRQFSVLATAGIPYDRALDILIQENQDQSFQTLLADIKSEITEGSSLAAALESRPRHFPGMYAAMVRAGEAGGTLAQVLDELTRFREEDERLGQKIQNAMIYPAIMAVLGMLIILFMLTFILPKITPIFSQFEAELPLPTQVVVWTSEVVSEHFILVALTFAGAFWGIRSWLKTPKGELLKDRILLKLPVIGHLTQQMILYRFCQTLGTLLSSGVELKHSLAILKGVLGNRIFEDPFDEMSNDIASRGMDLSAALKKTGLYPASVVQMIRVGEESDQLDNMLSKISSNLQKEVTHAVERLVALLEPVMILVMALLVGFIVLAVMLPLFQLNQLL